MSGYRDRFEKEVNRVGVSRIAQTLGIARNTVYNWMANGNAPLNKLLALEGLGIDVVYVLTGMPRAQQNEAHQVNQEVRPYGLDKDETLLLEGYRRSTPELRAAALRMLVAPKPEATPEPEPELTPIERESAIEFREEHKGKRTGPTEFVDNMPPGTRKRRKDQT